ncbi:MAG: hypothetical protein Q4F05_15950 [bacterium]|nr:hypothetical protein [bacterium]
MKSDQEFIDGIYAKAELLRSKNKSMKKKPLRFPLKRVAVFPVVAAAAAVLLLSDILHDPSRQKDTRDAVDNRSSQDSLVGQENSKVRMASNSYYVEGEVVNVLSSYMGYGRIELRVNQETSDITTQNTIIIAISNENSTYKKGTNVKATLIQQKIGTQEYYIIAE